MEKFKGGEYLYKAQYNTAFIWNMLRYHINEPVLRKLLTSTFKPECNTVKQYHNDST